MYFFTYILFYIFFKIGSHSAAPTILKIITQPNLALTPYQSMSPFSFSSDTPTHWVFKMN